MLTRALPAALLFVAHSAAAQTIPNGDFESGPLSNGWTSSGVNGGSASIVTQGTSFSTGDDTRTVTFPSPTHAMNVRSSGPAPTNSVGIATSNTFLVTREAVAWRQRSERTNVAIELRVLDAASNQLSSRSVTPNTGSFVLQSESVAGRCGQTIRLQFRQNTTTAGSGWYTLFDDVALSGAVCRAYVDADLDGYCPDGRDLNADGDCADAGEPGQAADCDDLDPTRNPGAPDLPANGIDEDCSGDFLCYEDFDGDGFGSGDGFVVPSIDADCDDPGEAADTDDCDDEDAGTNPAATDLVGDAFDQDCDGFYACWPDGDGDGFGVVGPAVLSALPTCATPGASTDADDCDDAAPAIFPGAAEVIGDAVDDNCDSLLTCYTDQDFDGFGRANPPYTVVNAPTCAWPGASENDDDCDDRDPTASPGGTEIPGDRVDQDCDGRYACFADADGDGSGTPGVVQSPNPSCNQAGESDDDDDCDDTDNTVFPGAVEIPADGIDQDCDTREVCYVDADGDDFGSAFRAPGPLTCDTPGLADNDDDCDDTRGSVFPGAAEIPADGIDQSCDGLEACYLDADLDQHGTGTLIPGPLGCLTAGVANQATDCDDAAASIHPGAVEIPVDGIDQNCDTLDACYVDADNDTFGSAALTTGPLTCVAAGVTTNDDDCDDADASTFPGAVDVPGDGIDQDCDNTYACFVDADADGVSGPNSAPSPQPCAGVNATPADCDDADATIRPGAVEQPADGVDQNCDGVEFCFADDDRDGAGVSALRPGPLACDADGVSLRDDDCDDTNPAVRPGAAEIPADAVDQDCDGLEACFTDDDGDSFGALPLRPGPLTCLGAGLADDNRDCDDTRATIRPGAVEVPVDAVDQDCDGREACFTDDDGDRFGTSTLRPGPLSCVGPDVSDNDDDCDDGAADTFPGAPEVAADGRDQDCDGLEFCFADNDRDGAGTPSLVTGPLTCQGDGLSGTADDCDDADPTTFPGAVEIPADGTDQDCDGLEACYVDADNDAFGSSVATPGPLACDTPGLADNDDDCDDRDPARFPGAAEVAADGIDQDCDGLDACYVDADGDGWGGSFTQPGPPSCTAPGLTTRPGDCDDTDAATVPGAQEQPADGIDQDCDGTELCFADADGDGIGAGWLQPGPLTCDDPGVSDRDDDCDDTDADVFPGAFEPAATGVDANCDGRFTCWLDADGDRHGNDEGRTIDAARADCDEVGASLTADDCDDQDGRVSPSARDVPGSGVDLTCDGIFACVVDADGDGFGNAAGIGAPSTDPTCQQPGLTVDRSDCDDTDPTIFPGAVEIPANDIDEDCSGEWTCFADADDDGVGSATVIPSADADCDEPGESSTDDDCDDTDPSVFPGAVETPGSGLDLDCDGLFTCWFDADDDGFGGPLTRLTDDPLCLDAGLSAAGEDCDDNAPDTFPRAPEVPGDGIDEDCDGSDEVQPDDTDDTDTDDTDLPDDTDPPDTDLPDDTDPTDTDDGDPVTPDEGWFAGGCGCDQGGSVSILLPLTLLLARRRRLADGLHVS